MSFYDVALCREYLFAEVKPSSTGMSAQPPAAGVERPDSSSVVGADGGTGNKKKRKRNRRKKKEGTSTTLAMKVDEGEHAISDQWADQLRAHCGSRPITGPSAASTAAAPASSGSRRTLQRGPSDEGAQPPSKKATGTGPEITTALDKFFELASR